MKNLFNFLTLILGNFVYSNYFFGKFQDSDYTIAIQGLNNFAEDLSDIGFPASVQVSYTFFVFLISLVSSLVIFYKFIKIDIFSNPVNILRLMVNLFILNLSTLSVVLYLFRFYSFPRSYLLLNIFIYPVFFTIMISLINADLSTFLYKSKIYYPIVVTFLTSIFIVFIINQFSSPTLKIEVNENEDNSIVESIEIEIPIENTDDNTCYKWSGSSNFKECRSATALFKIKNYPNTQVNNFVNFDKNLYTVLNTGIVMKNDDIFIDISDKVLNIYSESGLYDIAFHPNEDYFLLSYSNNLNELTIEKFQTNKDSTIGASQIIFTKPNVGNNHYCGSMEWSKTLNAFLFCVGDMSEENLSLSTVSQNGKILILNNENLMNPPLISNEKNKETIKNFVAYGLRNPWNFIEYENFLIVPDVGNKSNEELNIIDINQILSSKEPALFGWPIYEGSLLSEKTFYGLKMWNNKDLDLYDYILDNSKVPAVYYDRPAPENSRAAILGTLVFDNPESIYDKHIFFADFLSKEIFAYDFKNDNLYIINTPYFPGYLTSIGNHPYDISKIIFSTSNNGSSEVYELLLP